MADDRSDMDRAKLPPLPGSGDPDLSRPPLGDPPVFELPPSTASTAISSSNPRIETPAAAVDLESGQALAEHIDAANYHPVILFGNAFSGKTSLILSLLAIIKTDARLDAGIFLGSPILDSTTTAGGYQWDEACQFYGGKTQLFIEGKASPKTNINLPFFIPIVLRPTDKPEARIAFMESNGEWYRPDRQKSQLFPPLKKQIEDFLKHYQGGITFIHLLPYTQRALYSTEVVGGSEAEARTEASLAVAGALEAYNTVRTKRSADRHLILVTKWDAHRSNVEDAAEIEDLHDDSRAVHDFVATHYTQALAAFRGLRLPAERMTMNGYCAGQISGDVIIALKPGDERGEAIRRYPIGLWRWLYRAALENAGETAIDPFPTPHPSFFARIGRVLDRLF